MKKILSGALLGVMTFIPLLSHAQTYHYVNIRGEVVTLEAASSADALAQANARGDILHSGVKVDTGVLDTGDVVGVDYAYVTANGEVKVVTAASADAAFLLATDRAPHSGLQRLGLTE